MDCWLIESRHKSLRSGSPYYLSIMHYWTPNPHEAIRFCRKIDAKSVIDGLAGETKNKWRPKAVSHRFTDEEASLY